MHSTTHRSTLTYLLIFFLCLLVALAPPSLPLAASRQARAALAAFPAAPPPPPHLAYWGADGKPLVSSSPMPPNATFRLPPLTPRNTAYSMMACGGDAFHFSALIAARSIRRFDAERPIIILTTYRDLPHSDVVAALAALNATYHVVSEKDTLEMEARLHVRCGHFHNCWLKFFVWGLTRFAAVLNVDTDYLMLQDQGAAFDLFRRAATSPYDVGGVADLTVAFSHTDSSTADVFNGGWFLAAPSEDAFARLVEFAVGGARWKWGEMLTLNTFPAAQGGQWVRMPAAFNVVPSTISPRAPFFQYDALNRGSLFGLHFAGSSKVKPGTPLGDCGGYDGRGDCSWCCEQWVRGAEQAELFQAAVVAELQQKGGVDHHGLNA